MYALKVKTALLRFARRLYTALNLYVKKFRSGIFTFASTSNTSIISRVMFFENFYCVFENGIL